MGKFCVQAKTYETGLETVCGGGCDFGTYPATGCPKANQTCVPSLLDGGATEEGGQVVLRALDPKTGKRVWEYPMTGAGRMWTGTVSTAGGVIFSGDDDGHMVALDAKNGKHLWHFNVGELLTASPVVYSVDGKQYVAIASASAVFSFGLFEPSEPIESPVIQIKK